MATELKIYIPASGRDALRKILQQGILVDKFAELEQQVVAFVESNLQPGMLSKNLKYEGHMAICQSGGNVWRHGVRIVWGINTKTPGVVRIQYLGHVRDHGGKHKRKYDAIRDNEGRETARTLNFNDDDLWSSDMERQYMNAQQANATKDKGVLQNDKAIVPTTPATPKISRLDKFLADIAECAFRDRRTVIKELCKSIAENPLQDSEYRKLQQQCATSEYSKEIYRVLLFAIRNETGNDRRILNFLASMYNVSDANVNMRTVLMALGKQPLHPIEVQYIHTFCPRPKLQRYVFAVYFYQQHNMRIIELFNKYIECDKTGKNLNVSVMIPLQKSLKEQGLSEFESQFLELLREQPIGANFCDLVKKVVGVSQLYNDTKELGIPGNQKGYVRIH